MLPNSVKESNFKQNHKDGVIKGGRKGVGPGVYGDHGVSMVIMTGNYGVSGEKNNETPLKAVFLLVIFYNPDFMPRLPSLTPGLN